MRAKLLYMVLLLLGMSFSAIAQQRTISGTVTDEKGETVPGISVLIKGTTQGTTTDVDGKYNISANEGAILVFQGIGYTTQEIAVSASNTIDVTLQTDQKMLGEVVVTGVAEGTSTKKLGFAISKINEKALQEVPALDPANAIRGKISGAQIVQGTGIPGTAPNIRLRGATNIQGVSSPLIIVDGIITAPGTTLADINMNDVEAIEVIKGAAGASLYGSQAANGVIQIITKRGADKEGQTRVTVRSEYGATGLQRRFPLSTHHYYQLNADGSFKLSDPNDPTSRIPETDGYMDNNYAKNFDQQDLIFSSRSFYNNYVSVASTFKNTNFLASVDNLVTQGVVQGLPAFDRKNARLNVDHKLNDKLKLSVSSLFSSSKGPQATERQQGGVFYSVLLNEPFIDLNAPNADGTPYDNVTPNVYNNATNPLYIANNNKITLSRERFIGNLAMSYQLFESLRLEGQYSFDRSWQLIENWRDRNYISRNFPTGDGGALFQQRDGTTGQLATMNAHFNKALMDKTLKLSGTVRYQWEKYNTDLTALQGTKFAASGTHDAAYLDRTTVQLTNRTTDIRAENVFLTVRADYKDRYIIDALIRSDASSLFGKDVRRQSFYRISGAYRLSEDIKIPGIEEIKLRASYGTSGQRPQFQDQYETFNSSNGVLVKTQLGNTGLKPSKVGEFETGINVSFLKRFNFEFNYAKTVAKDQILSVPLAPWVGGYGYQVRNAGTLESKTWEFSIGGDAIKANKFTWNFNIIGSRSRSRITKLGVPPYATDGTYGQASAGGVANNMFRIQEGEAFGVMYGNIFATSLSDLTVGADGFVNNLYQITGKKPEDFEVNSDGYIVLKGTQGTAAERAFALLDESGQRKVVKIGDSNPDIILGLSNTFTYGKLSLYTLLDIQMGGNIYNATKQLLYFNERHKDLDQADKAQGEKKAIQYYTAANSLYNGNDPSQYFVEKGGFVTIREINISYNFDRSFFEKLGSISKFIYDARLALIGRNLFTFTRYTGYNPEVALANNSSSFRVDQFAYPIFRTYTVSLQLKF